MKRCWMCGETKPVVAFGVDRYRKDGRNNKCRPCDATRCADYDAHRRRRPPRTALPPRDRSLNHLEYQAAYARAWRTANPVAARVREARGSGRKQAATAKAAIFREKHWTAEEDALVFAADMSDVEIAFALGRTYKSVHGRRNKLRAAGFVSRDRRNHAAGFRASGLPWTAAEDAMLMEHSRGYLVALLGRTAGAITRRRQRLGLTSPQHRPTWTWAQARPHLPRPATPCALCGKPLPDWRRTYCPDSCAVESARARAHARAARKCARAEWDRATRICGHDPCGAAYTPAWPWQAYCDKTCAKRAERRRAHRRARQAPRTPSLAIHSSAA